jgi:hypothetical protein
MKTVTSKDGRTIAFDHLAIKPIKLECIRMVAAPGVTHVGYRIVKERSS